MELFYDAEALFFISAVSIGAFIGGEVKKLVNQVTGMPVNFNQGKTGVNHPFCRISHGLD